jgi:hypothetical protein
MHTYLEDLRLLCCCQPHVLERLHDRPGYSPRSAGAKADSGHPMTARPCDSNVGYSFAPLLRLTPWERNAKTPPELYRLCRLGCRPAPKAQCGECLSELSMVWPSLSRATPAGGTAPRHAARRTVTQAAPHWLGTAMLCSRGGQTVH